MSIFKLAGPCSVFTSPVKPREIVTAAHSLGIYAGVNGSRISSAPLEEMLKTEGLAAARTVRAACPGRRGARGAALFPCRRNQLRRKCGTARHRGTGVLGALAATLQRRTGLPCGHGHGMARPRHIHGMAMAPHGTIVWL